MVCKKIGVVTLSDSKENYGQILQSYALISFLRKLGYDGYLIRVRHREIDDRTFLQKNKERLIRLFHLKTFIASLKERKEIRRQHLIMENSIKQHDRYFESFIEKNIPCTKTWYDDISIVDKTPEADAYICGSDQIWGSDLSYMYLEFVKDEKIKISYAASFGGFIPPVEVEEKIKGWLLSFKWITVREYSGLDVLKKVGIYDAEVVPDPTLLLENIDYRKLYKLDKSCSSKKFLFLYLLGNKISVDVSDIYEMAIKNNLQVVYVTAHGREDEYTKQYPSIEDWLQLIDNSEIVITNSYHCTIFSLQFRKKFLTLPIVGVRSRMNTRIIELLEKYDLTERLYTNKLEKVFDDIDYTKFEKISNDERLMIREKFSKILL